MRMVKDVLSSGLFWIGAGLSGLYWILAALLPPLVLINIMNAFIIFFSFSVMIAYLPAFKEAFDETLPPRAVRSARVALGIVLAWLAVVFNRTYLLFWRELGEPKWMIDHPIIGFIILISLFGALLHISVRDAVSNKIPAQSWKLIGFAMAGTFLLSILVLMRQFDVL